MPSLREHYDHNRPLALFFISGVIVSFLLFSIINELASQRAHNALVSASEEHLISIRAEAKVTEDLLLSLAALEDASDHVSEQEFHLFNERVLLNLGYVEGALWLPRVKYHQRSQFVEKTRQNGYPDYRIITDDAAAKLKRDLFPVHYYASLHEHDYPRGIDIAADNQNHTVMERAIASGSVSSTLSHPLQWHRDQPFSSLLLMPVYNKGKPTQTPQQRQQHLKGFVGVYINIDDFMGATLANRSREMAGVDIYLFESTFYNHQQQIYFHPSRSRSNPDIAPLERNILEKSYHLSSSFYFTDREWEFLILPAPGFYLQQRAWEPYFVLVISLVLTFLASALFFIINNRRQYAELLVDERTDELSRNALRLQALQTITSSNQEFDEKITALLKLGLGELALDVGILSNVDGNDYTVISAMSPDDSIPAGAVFELGDTYCCSTLTKLEVTSFTHAAQSDWKHHPCYEKFCLECYIGTPVLVNSEIYGTLNFSSSQPRTKVFTTDEHEFVKLMAQWISFEIERNQFENQLANRNTLLNSVSRAQTHYIAEADERAVFDSVLTDILHITQSEFGFIGGIYHNEDAAPYLKTFAISNIAWDEETSKFYDENAPGGMEFSNLDTMFGYTIRTGETLIENDPGNSPHAGGLPKGHPPIHSYLGLPLFHGNKLVGMLSLANASPGYNEAIINYIRPITSSCGNLIWAIENDRQRISAEHALLDSRRMLHTVLDNIPARVFWKNTQGVYLGCNSLFARDAGYESIKDIIGKTDKDMPWHEQAEQYIKDDRQVMQTHKPILNIEEPQTVHTGELIWLETNKVPLTNINNEVFGVIGSYRDITERKNAQQAVVEQKEKITHILESTSDAYMAINFDWNITFANQRIKSVLNILPDDIIGKDVREVAADVTNHFLPKIYSSLAERNGQVVRKYFSPTNKWLEANINPTEDGISINFRDVTENVLALAELQEKENTIRTIMDTVIDGIVTVNQQGQINSFNHAAEKIFGYSAAQAAGKLFTRLLPEIHHDMDFDLYLGTSHKISGIRSSGEQFPMELAITELLLNNTNYYTIVVRDLAERIRSEQLLSETLGIKNAILDSANFSIITTDLEGTITSFNSGAEQMLGYSANEVINRLTPQILHDADEIVDYARELSQEFGHPVEPGFDVLVLKAKEDIPDEREWSYVAKDGKHIPVLLSVTSIKNELGINIGYLGIAADITERKKIEQMKDEFISVVSHELRTPLTSIRGSIGLLTGGAMGELPTKFNTLLDIANTNTERLLLLINDILDINKIESGKMNFQLRPVSVHDLLQTAVDNNATYGKQYKVQFNLEQVAEDVYINADEPRLMQVLTNLMSNAAKFSHENSEVDISAIKSNDTVRISVLDKGIGIAEEFKDKIFDKFTQADSSDSRHVGGTGLGMSITKAIIEQHGGQLNFVSHKGVGTTFYFDLPLYYKDQIADEQLLVKVNRANQRKVLICEDDYDTAAMLSMLLTRAGFTTHIAYTAAEARYCLQKNHYHAMTLDILLPDRNGISLLQELREDPRTNNLPVIVVSAVREEQLDTDTSSVFEWLDKPVDNERLIATLKYAIKGLHEHARILHVEDDPDVQKVVSLLVNNHADVSTVQRVSEAKQKLSEQHYDLVLLDVSLPDGSGIELLEIIRQAQPPIPTVIFSAHELNSSITSQVDQALIKSRTTNQELIDVIKNLIA